MGLISHLKSPGPAGPVCFRAPTSLPAWGPDLPLPWPEKKALPDQGHVGGFKTRESTSLWAQNFQSCLSRSHRQAERSLIAWVMSCLLHISITWWI